MMNKNDQVSTDVWTILEVEHLVTTEVWITKDTMQWQDDQDNVGHTNIQAREPSRKIRKNHPATNIIKDLEASVWTWGCS